MSAPDPVPAQTPPAFVKALRHALRPLLRVMLARGMTLPQLTELIKSLLVEVAEQDFRIGGKPATDSRVSLLTGVHRKDVNRLRRGGADPSDAMPAVVSLGAQLVAQWVGKPQFLGADGQPLDLPRYASEGGEQSFEALVASLNSDIRSRVVLDEWLRLGVVHLNAQRQVCLNTQAFVPAQGFDEQAFYFGHNLHDHAAAAAHNLMGQAPPFLERSLHFKGLSPAAITELAALAEKRGMQALVAVNQSAQALDSAAAPADASGPTSPPAPQRMTFGIYFYTEPAALDALEALDEAVLLPPEPSTLTPDEAPDAT